MLARRRLISVAKRVHKLSFLGNGISVKAEIISELAITHER